MLWGGGVMDPLRVVGVGGHGCFEGGGGGGSWML